MQQPVWGPDGALYYVGDASGWWNLYKITPEQLAAPGSKVRWLIDAGAPGGFIRCLTGAVGQLCRPVARAIEH